MPVLLLNTPAIITTDVGFNVYGEETPGTSTATRCAVISFSRKPVPSPNRAELSASRARADIEAASVVALFDPSTSIKQGDTVAIYGQALRVTDIFPRADQWGRLDRGHLQVTMTGKAG